ncbi:hypothetical protein D3C86_1818440 [compost metagenome]
MVPAAFSSNTSSINIRCISGSRPEVGSSRIMSFGLCMKAATMPTFCFMPLDILRIGVAASNCRRRIRRSRLEVSFTPCIEVMKLRKLVPVMPSIKLISPGRYPVSFCTVPCPFQASSPPIVTEPRSGCMNPMM